MLRPLLGWDLVSDIKKADNRQKAPNKRRKHKTEKIITADSLIRLLISVTLYKFIKLNRLPFIYIFIIVFPSTHAAPPRSFSVLNQSIPLFYSSQATEFTLEKTWLVVVNWLNWLQLVL